MASAKQLRTVLSLEGERAYLEGLKRISANLGQLATEQSLLNSQYDKGDRSLAKLTRQQDILRRKLDEQRRKVEMINKVYQESVKRGDANAETTQRLASELNMAQAAVNRTVRELDKLSQEMEHANSRTAQFADAMRKAGVTTQSVGGMLQSVGDKVSKLSFAIAAGVTTAAVKGWMSLEDEMANVATIADTSEKSIEQLTTEIIGASNATGVMASELAKAQYQAISANVATADSVGLVENAAKAAKAGVSDVTTVIDGATSILNAWGISAADSEQVFDKLLKTQQRGKTTIGELAASIGQVTGLAPQLNISLEETLAAVGALTQNGVSTSSAMTGLKAVMSAVLKPTAEATEEAERLGLQFDSTALKSKGLTGFLQDVMDKTGGSEESLAKLFGSVEGLSQIMLLGGSAAGLYADILYDLNNSAGTLDTMFDTRMSSSSQKLSMALNQVKNAALSLGESMAPMIGAAADKVQAFADAVSSMSTEQALSVVKTALWVAAISKAISILGGVIKNISSIRTAITAVSTVIRANPWIAVITAVGAAIAGVAAIAKKASAEAELDISVDESELEEYKIDTYTLDNPITIEAEAKLAIKQGINNYGLEIVRWLTDGLPETRAELDGYVEQLNWIIAPAFDSINAFYEQKKTELDNQLAAGIISQAEYDAAMTALEEQTTAFESDITNAANAVTAYITTLAANNKTMTEEEIAQLNALLETLGLTSDAVIEATNAQKQAYEYSYKKVAAGVGDDTDRKRAIEYIELSYTTDKATLDNAAAAVRSKYAEKSASATTAEEIAELAAQEEAELAAIQTQIDALNDRRDAQYRELLTAELAKTGLTPEEIRVYLSDKAAEEAFEYNPLDWSNGVPQREYKSTGIGIEHIKEQVNNADWSNIEELLGSWAANGTGSAEAIDSTTDALGTLIDLLNDTSSLDTLPEDYGEIGDNAASSMISSFRAHLPSMYTAGVDAGNQLISGAKSALQIASPSKVFKRIGEFTMDGLIGGVNTKLDAVQATYRKAVSPKTTGSTDGAPKAAAATPTVINNHINYTAGAGTRREARMLNRMLAQEQQAALIAGGL